MQPLHRSPAKSGPRRAYDRLRDLPRLIGLWPHELADTSGAARRQLCRRLSRALRMERRRGIAGHWTYDLGRHAALLAAYRVELGVLQEVVALPDSKKPAKPAGLSHQQ